MQTYCACLSLSSSSYFIYECMTDINHTLFERQENFLSTDNKIFCLERIYERDIRANILYRSFIEKCGFVLMLSLFFIVSFYFYRSVIKISYIGFERGEDALSFRKEIFFQHLSIEAKWGSTFCAITFASYVNKNCIDNFSIIDYFGSMCETQFRSFHYNFGNEKMIRSEWTKLLLTYRY